MNAPTAGADGAAQDASRADGIGTLLWLVRHPRPAVPTGWCYGASDVPIEDEHLDELLELLPRQLPRHAPVYSSPLSRCLRLARGLHAAGFSEPRIDARLREMDFGGWEGRPWSEVPRAQIDAWRDDLVGYTPPGGEPLAALAERALDFVSALAEHREAIVVTHAGVMQTLARALRGMPLSEFGGLRIDYGQVLRLRREPQGWSLLGD